MPEPTSHAYGPYSGRGLYVDSDTQANSMCASIFLSGCSPFELERILLSLQAQNMLNGMAL